MLRSHAQGGLGLVLVAQDEELRRQVAFKQILPRLADDPESQARFVREAEITGGLEHPGIIPVYSLGRDAAGRPYYAMRFVQGESLKDAIGRFHEPIGPGSATKALQLRALLRRFIDVCNAVEYAHSQSIMHRDLKPSNIMLGRFGETLVVDWGLARPFDSQGLDERECRCLPSDAGETGSTQAGAQVGTPQYMSPEQATGDLSRVGPWSDVYSLGATLYHLLTGRAPFLDENVALLLKKVEQGEFLQPREVAPSVPRPLEAICLKAMSQRPEQRYASPVALSDDLERWLADEPVSCCQEPWGVRLGRRARRHRVPVAVATAAMLMGLLGLTVLVGIVSVKNRSLQEAHELQRLAKEDAESKGRQADLARQQSEQVLDYLVKAFARPSAHIAGEKLTIQEALDQAVAHMHEDFPEQPLIRIRLLSAIGQTYYVLRLNQQAVEVRQQALALCQSALGAEHDETLTAQSHLAQAYQLSGQWKQALLLCEEVVVRRKAALGEDHPLTLDSLSSLARAHQSLGELDTAVKLYQHVLARRRAVSGADHPKTIRSISDLGEAHRSARQFDLAIELLEQVLSIRREALGPDHHETLAAMNELAGTYQCAGQPEPALVLLEEVAGRQAARSGRSHPLALRSINDLAAAHHAAGNSEKAIELFQSNLQQRQAALGADHPDTLDSMRGLAELHRSAGRLREAIELYEQALPLMRSRLGDDHPQTLVSMDNLALAYQSAGRSSEALPLFAQCLAFRRARLGDEHSETLTSVGNLAAACETQGDHSRAEPLRLEVVQMRKQAFASDHPDIAIALSSLASNLLAQKKYIEAEPVLRECLSIRLKRLPDDWSTFHIQSLLGEALSGQTRYADAEPLLLQGYQGMKERLETAGMASRPRRLTEAAQRLVQLYEDLGKVDEAENWRIKARH